MSWDSIDQALVRLRETKAKQFETYLGFYSSWLGGYFREPWAMTLPLDDHGFHRGDAVFEAARICNGAMIAFDAHLERLAASAAAIEMPLPKSTAEIGQICLELARRAEVQEGVLRLYVTRGPGGFGPSPRESVGAQIFAAITTIKPPVSETYTKGVRAMVSSIPAKEARWSRIKSCNYLQNVMMKKETLDKGFDFALSVDDQGRVCEGATENFMIVSAQGELLVPNFDYTLRGTTVRTVMELGQILCERGFLSGVRLADLTLADVRGAREAAFVGTTIGVLPLASLDDQTFAGRAIARELNERLQHAWTHDERLRTAF